jgi:hypothetical protein
VHIKYLIKAHQARPFLGARRSNLSSCSALIVQINSRCLRCRRPDNARWSDIISMANGAWQKQFTPCRYLKCLPRSCCRTLRRRPTRLSFCLARKQHTWMVNKRSFLCARLLDAYFCFQTWRSTTKFLRSATSQQSTRSPSNPSGPTVLPDSGASTRSVAFISYFGKIYMQN